MLWSKNRSNRWEKIIKKFKKFRKYEYKFKFKSNI